MRVVIEDDYDGMSRAAADVVAGALAAEPRLVLGLPTGATMVGTYAELVRRHRAAGLSFARATTFNLDEYLGLGPDHPASCRRYLEERLVRQVDLDRARVHFLDGRAPDPVAYELAIAGAGGIDLMLLGIGGNGHIGFNEPGSSFGSRTRQVTLTGQSREANAHWFGAEPVPGRAVTMGIGTILESDRIVLLASGAAKAAIVAAAVEGPVDPAVPASALQMHTDVTIVLDRDAASALSGERASASG